MKITVTRQVRLSEEEIKYTDLICEGLTVPEIAEELKIEKKKAMAVRNKLFRKLAITDALQLYKMVHTDCPHCGKDIEYLPLGLKE